ncbi:MAG: SGNH/GDSL hydrolase family protein [Bacteroidales bacterium]
MNHTARKYLLLIFLFWITPGCEPEPDLPDPYSGEADFTTYAAIGNSLTAGFKDGELFRNGQEHSLANLMAGQLMHAGLSSFSQPLMKDELGFGNRLVLAEINGSLMPVPAPGSPDPANSENIFDEDGPFHNLGVPGAKVEHLLFRGYGTLNPYFGRFAANPASSSVITDALALQPTFFSLWAGNNDILGFATSGGKGEGITSAEEFATFYQMMVSQLTQEGARGVVANIPDIKSIPFFSTVPYNALPLTEQAMADQLNSAYQEAPHISFSVGMNALVAEDTTHPAGIRQLEEGEIVLLTALTGITQQGWGSQTPLPETHYLSETQVTEINEATAAFNQVIRETATASGLAHVDIHQRLQEAGQGFYIDGIAYDSSFITGGIFSLDGIHLSKRGSAIVANDFIEAINEQFDATIPKVTVNQIEGIPFP